MPSIALSLLVEPSIIHFWPSSSITSVETPATLSDTLIMDEDGQKKGYDIALTKAVSESVNIPVIASGGAGALEHFYDAFTEGKADAVLAASLFHFGEIPIPELKKYLNEFTLIAEREITETIIWKEYMVYATLFGIADKVIEQFKKVYPEKIPELETYNRNVIIAHSYYRSMYRSSQRAMQARRTSGSGGRASFGGGGGFSGGGRGGGSR